MITKGYISKKKEKRRCIFQTSTVCPEYGTLLILCFLFKNEGLMKLNSKDNDVYSVHGVCLVPCELRTLKVRFANGLRLTVQFVTYPFIYNDNQTENLILVDNGQTFQLHSQCIMYTWRKNSQRINVSLCLCCYCPFA